MHRLVLGDVHVEHVQRHAVEGAGRPNGVISKTWASAGPLKSRVLEAAAEEPEDVHWLLKLRSEVVEPARGILELAADVTVAEGTRERADLEMQVTVERLRRLARRAPLHDRLALPRHLLHELFW